jgi:hypothetical protein
MDVRLPPHRREGRRPRHPDAADGSEDLRACAETEGAEASASALAHANAMACSTCTSKCIPRYLSTAGHA